MAFNIVLRTLFPLLLLLISVSSAPAATGKPYPLIKNSAAILKDFIPAGWKLGDQAIGDLNNDGKADIAAIIEGPDIVLENRACDEGRKKASGLFPYDPDRENPEQINGAILNPSWPRILIILFANKTGGYQLALQDNNIIPRHNEGGMFDPVGGLSAEDALQIRRNSLFLLVSGGTAWRWYISSQFRYEKRTWRLIGYTHFLEHIHTKSEHRYDYNLLTGKLIVYTRDEKGKRPGCIFCLQGEKCSHGKGCEEGFTRPTKMTTIKRIKKKKPLTLQEFHCMSYNDQIIPWVIP
jgi:hypothetical protein